VSITPSGSDSFANNLLNKKNMKQIVLTSIGSAIDNISFAKKRYYKQAKTLVAEIYRQFLFSTDGIDFSKSKQFPISFFETIISAKCDLRIVIKELKNAEILITDDSYSTGTKQTKAYCKSYLINYDLLFGTTFHFTQFIGINKINNKIKFTKIKKNLDLITVDNAVFSYIPILVENQIGKIKIGSFIQQEMIKIRMGAQVIEKHKSYWITIANRNNVALIQLKENFYIESVRRFIERKRIELNMLYTYTIENIINGNFYASRNLTNNRLDHNLTGLKKELFKFILLDGEKTTEIDICNAQFAIMSNIKIFDIDENFREITQNGTLYEFIMNQMEMTRDAAKQYMMTALFGVVQSHPKVLKKLFPRTMNSIAKFKNENGYKSFSVMLQKAESNLMIDGVYNLLTKNKIPTIPVHDSMRVKESDYIKASQLMIDYFIEKNFKCELKSKD
jgi:hypothetical protein